MLTLFTWGYWGWGTSTRELVRAVDATEKKRGFEPPIFVDIRLRRSVRVPGFSGNAFAHVVGASRYQWMPRLGNRRIALGESGVQIDDPSAARDLIRLAIECARRHQRVLFFCACEDLATKRCHRTKVADLVLKEAAQQRRRVEIVEWPGSKPTYTTLAVTPEILKGIACGRKSVPLDSIDLKEFAGLPWGSVVTLHAGEQALPIVTGPAKYHRDWCLQVVHSGEIGGDAGHLKRWGAKFRKAKGLEYRRL